MSPGRKRLLIVLCCILILGAPLLLFRDVLGFQFLNYDDDIYVTGNPIVHSLDFRNLWAMVSQGYFRSYQPLTLLTHAVDYALWGDDAWGHHLTNLLLHVSNGLLLFGLTVLLLRVRPSPDGAPGRATAPDEEVVIVVGAAVAALLFAIHPLRVESVAWISDRKDLLMSFFLIPSCAAYLQSRNGSSVWRQRIWMWSSVGLFACAVLAKTVAVVFPLALVLLDLFLVSPSRWRQEAGKMVRSKVPYLALSLVLGVIALSVGSGHTMSRFIRDLTFTNNC